MDVDIENINTFEKRNKVNTIKWRPIYEVIDEAYFMDYKIFSHTFMQKCKDNTTDAQFIPLEMKKYNKLKGNGTSIICTRDNAMRKRFEICGNR